MLVKGQIVALTIIGFLVGALAAGGIGVRVIEEVRTDEDATSLPAENVAPRSDYLVDPNEVLIGSAVLIPTSVSGSGTAVTVGYEVISVAPTGEIPQPGTPALIRPNEWEVTTASGTYSNRLTNEGSQSVQFDLPEGESITDIVSARIIDPLVAYPLDTTFQLSAAEPTAEITPGVRAELIEVSTDDTSTVRVRIASDDPLDRLFIIEGSGAGWGSVVEDAEGEQWTLEWLGEDLPPVARLRAHGIQWIVESGAHELPAEGLQ